MTDASLRDKFAAKSERDQALVATSLVIFVWGITPLFIKEATFIVDVPTVTFYRNLCSPVVLWVISRLVTGGWHFDQIRKCLLPGALFGFSMIAGFIGVHETSVANSALIGALQPALVMLVAPKLFGERITVAKVLLSIGALSGVSMVILAASSTSGASMRGDLWSTGNVVIWTIYFLVSKRRRDDGADASVFIASVMTVAAVVTLPWSLSQANDLGNMTTKTWVLIALIALLPSGVGHTLMTWSQKHLDVTVSSLMMLGSPCVAMVAAWLVRHEALDPLQIVGAVIVIACLAGIMVRARRRLDPLEATLGEPV